jgi:C-terminal peptidase prc
MEGRLDRLIPSELLQARYEPQDQLIRLGIGCTTSSIRRARRRDQLLTWVDAPVPGSLPGPGRRAPFYRTDIDCERALVDRTPPRQPHSHPPPRIRENSPSSSQTIPAESWELKPKYLSPSLIHALDGIPVEQIAREAESRVPPPSNSRSRIARITRAIQSRIYGAPETEVSIVYSDKDGGTREQTITRAKRNGVDVGPLFLATESEARLLENEIGYIRVNTLQPQLATRISEAVRSMRHLNRVILDLRGNPGGEIENMFELFLRDRALLYLQKSRNGEQQVFDDPADDAFEGPLALLIDQLSGSASELIAASLQAIGRAVVVGERSAGSVMEADTMIFPNGAIFMYPVAQISTPDGTVLEAHGVVPDIEVRLEREMLLKGIDSQLDFAIRYIDNERKE